MPLSHDPVGGGTETDGRMSTEYCSYCYKDGGFAEPNLTIGEMVKRVEDQFRDMNVSASAADSASNKIPKLKRWNTR